jgi:hypothetical protein
MLFLATQGAAQLSTYWGRPGERPMTGAAVRAALEACGNPALMRVEQLTPHDVGVLAYALQHPGREQIRCVRHDADAALAMLEAYAGDPIPFDSGSLALARLAELYRARPSDRRAQRRLSDIRRILWLRGYEHPTPDDPLFTPAERERLLSDTANVALLRRWVTGYEWDHYARDNLASALLLESAPHYDPVEAASFISGNPAGSLRLRLIQALLVDPRTFSLALDQLPQLTIHHGWLTSRDVLLLESIIERATRLFDQGTEPERTTGARMLAGLAERDVMQARGALLSAMDRNGCCLVMQELPADAGVRPLHMSDDHYPRSAARSGMSGRFRLEAFFAPDGKLLYIDGDGGEPSSLRRAAIAGWRRALANVELRATPGYYTRVAGPVFEFRMPRCESGVALPMPAPDPEVVTVDGPCFQPPMF